MIVPALTASEAELYLDALRRNESRAPNAYEVGSAGRQEFRQRVEHVAAELELLRGQFSRIESASAPLEFDAEAAVLLHCGLPLEDRLVAHDDFWRYLTCVEFYEAVKWRHASDGEDGFPKLDHFGLGRKWDCFAQRLWLRAELSVDHADSEDPYKLTRRGGTDFWTSGLLRILYSCNRSIARALVRLQFPQEGRFRGHNYRPQTLAFDGARALYKRLRHFHAILGMSTLTDEEADALLHDLARDLPRLTSVD